LMYWREIWLERVNNGHGQVTFKNEE